MNDSVSRWSAPWLCAATFTLLKLLADIFQAFYYGVGFHLSSVFLGAIIVSIAGTLGYLSGAWVLRRQLTIKAVLYTSFLAYFVSYSVSRLLSSLTTAPWLFLAGLVIITFVITVRLGPGWDRS